MPTMQAIRIPRYGNSDVLEIAELPRPTPGAREVLLRVQAASINAADLHMLHGSPGLLRLAMGLRAPRIKALGADVAGVVEAVGEGVTEFSVGDEVLGDLSGSGFGACAEVAVAPANVLVRKPPALKWSDAAALPMAAVTALHGLRDAGRVLAGERVLVTGAAGGVGSFAVQIARTLGAEVAAVVRPAKADVVRALGVSEIHDEASLAAGALDGRFDLVLDAAAFRGVFGWRRALRRGGRCVVVGGTFGATLASGLLGPLVGPLLGRGFGTYMSKPNAKDLQQIVDWASTGVIRPIVDRTYPLTQAAAAVAWLEERRVRGKVVVVVDAA